MAYAFINSVTLGAGSSGGTSAAVNMAGADFFVVIAGSGGSMTAPPTWSDSLSNSHWTNLTVNNLSSVISYCWNASSSSSMTFTISAPAASFPGCVIMGFSGSQTSSDPLDVERHSDQLPVSSSAQFPVALTPGAANELFFWGFGNGTSTDTYTCSGYTVVTKPFTGGTNYEGVGAYKIKTDAVAEQPTVVDVQGSPIGAFACIACFKVAASTGSVGATAGTATVAGVGASTFGAVAAASGIATVAGVSAATVTGVASASGAATVAGVTSNSGTTSGVATVAGVGASGVAAIGVTGGSAVVFGGGSTGSIGVAAGGATVIAVSFDPIGEADGFGTVIGVSASTFAAIASASGHATVKGVSKGGVTSVIVPQLRLRRSVLPM